MSDTLHFCSMQMEIEPGLALDFNSDILILSDTYLCCDFTVYVCSFCSLCHFTWPQVKYIVILSLPHCLTSAEICVVIITLLRIDYSLVRNGVYGIYSGKGGIIVLFLPKFQYSFSCPNNQVEQVKICLRSLQIKLTYLPIFFLGF